VHCYRRTDRLVDLRKLSRHGVAVSFDNDDYMTALDTAVTADGTGIDSGIHILRQNKRWFSESIKAARLADLTTTTSELIAERYRREGASNVVVIGNAVEPRMFGFGSRSKHEGVVIGWVAGGEHYPDLEQIPITDAIRRLLEAHPHVRLLTVGVRLPIDSQRYRHVRGIEFPELMKAIGGIDIGIAPLAETPFNRCRSDIKLKEYASGGAAWLASPVGPYRALGESEGGMLVADDGWYAALDMLIRKPRLRKRLSKRARAWAAAQTTDKFADLWEAAFEEAIHSARDVRSMAT
jgi:glycosyltransferase involved in cell wall biosynthesis